MIPSCLSVVVVAALAAEPQLSSAPYPDGIEDEAAYASWLSRQADALAALTAPEDTEARARHLGYRANWIMAYRCEPYVSRILLGLASSDDAVQLTAHAAQARAALEQAAQLDGVPFAVQDDLEFLMGVNSAMALLAAAQDTPLTADQVGETTTDLAIWLDDERAVVAGSARLWQNLLFRASGQFDRALHSLPAAVEPLSDDRAGFFSRILRCLIHADRGQFSLSAALLLKMEERCAQWFDAAPDASRAELTLSWNRLSVARRDQRARRELPERLTTERLERARGYIDEDMPAGLMRLHPAVPMIVKRQVQPPAPPAAPEAERPAEGIE